MLHLEHVAIYVRSPDYLNFAYEMMKDGQRLQADLVLLQRRLVAVASKIEDQNEDAKAPAAGKASSKGKTAAVGVKGSG